MRELSFKITALSLGLFLTISYILCVIYGLIFHNYAMHKAWEPLLPGFYWLSVGGFFIGLVESFLYGVYVALVFVPIYNFLCRKMTSKKAKKY